MRFIFLYNKYSTYLFKSLPTTLKILLKKHHFKGRTLCFVTDHHICFPYHVTYVIDDFKIRLCKKNDLRNIQSHFNGFHHGPKNDLIESDPLIETFNKRECSIKLFNFYIFGSYLV